MVLFERFEDAILANEGNTFWEFDVVVEDLRTKVGSRLHYIIIIC